MSFLTSLYSPGNIMDGVDISNLTIEQYLKLTQESQTPKKIEDMTITEYLEYEKKVNENHISNTKSYLPTYFGKSILTHDPIREFAHYFGVESDCDSEDIEEDVEYMTDNEVGVENMKDALISIIKSIRQEMKDGIMKRQVEASTTCLSDEVSSITSNEVDRADDNISNTAPCRLPKELSPGSFLLPFNINNHNFYATTTLDDKDNIMPQRVYEYLEFEQRTRSYGTPNPQDEIAEPISFSLDRRGLVKRWHVCKPIHVTYDDKSSGMWLHVTLTKNYALDLMKSLGVHYGQQKINDTTRERSYDVKEEYAMEIGNPYSRRFDEYNMVFNNEIEHLSNEYILRIGKKGYVLDDDEALPLGHVNGARFKAMIRKELEGNKIQQLRGNYRGRLDSKSCGNLAESATVTA
ncbi:hypothetical protein Tco_0966368 [Tanacetum coccineum]